jgi:hypothetical protein
LKNEVEESLISKLENFTPKFWVDFNADYFNFLALKMFPLKNYLRDFYRMRDEEIFEFSINVETEVYNSIKKDILKRTKEISSIAVELFKKKFWYEKDNNQRQWHRIEEEEIDNLFKKFRNEYNDLFEQFKFFRVVRYPLKCKYIINI